MTTSDQKSMSDHNMSDHSMSRPMMDDQADMIPAKMSDAMKPDRTRPVEAAANAPTAAGRKLPVLTTVLESFRDISANWQAAIRLTWAWGALFAIVAIAAFATIVGAQATLAASPWITLAVVYLPVLTFFVFMMSVALGWHRLVLLGEQPAALYLRVDRQLWRYAGAILLLGLLSGLVAIVFLLPTVFVLGGLLGQDVSQWTAGKLTIAVLVGIAAYIPVLVFAMRISIALPAKAIGARMKIAEALRATQGNAWRILGGSALISVPICLVYALMDLFLELQIRMANGDLNWLGIAAFLALMAVALIAIIALTLVSISFFSRAYRFLADRTGQATPPAWIGLAGV